MKTCKPEDDRTSHDPSIFLVVVFVTVICSRESIYEHTEYNGAEGLWLLEAYN